MNYYSIGCLLLWPDAFFKQNDTESNSNKELRRYINTDIFACNTNYGYRLLKNGQGVAVCDATEAG